MKTHRVALYPGDGIGPEVTDAAVAVLTAVQEKSKTFDIAFERFDWGMPHFERHGRVVPEDFLATLRGFDAVFLGAVGWPARLPDHITLTPLIRLRQAFDLYACVRPARTFKGVRGPLRSEEPIDLVVVRENSEGEYVDNGGALAVNTANEVAVQTAVHTRRGVERILRFSFALARTRARRLAMITKSNAQRYAYVLWDRVLVEIAAEFEDVAVEKLHIDAATLELVRRPHTFDVIVGSNLFGDILSDLTGGITGSLGLNPSANLNPERRFPSLFEPVHGSAPDIAGKGIANPTAAVLSAAMMLDWLGEAHAAVDIRAAVDRALAAGNLTPDIGGTLTTTQMTQAIVQQIE
ncbi:MAG TPA: isocitrate/isopropylmalate family dehydrogenase [Vicinamibacterales bacterium]|nr:isocitrate/isopropylmalate family dehydrogenase [Vicinamibacterales bacterium]